MVIGMRSPKTRFGPPQWLWDAESPNTFWAPACVVPKPVLGLRVSPACVVPKPVFLVPTRQRGNAVSNAPTLRERDAGASQRHSHAGAWEREETYLCA